MQSKVVYKHIIMEHEPVYKEERYHKGMTIACCNDPEDPKYVFVSVAICNNSDSYSRKVGRETCINKDPDRILLKELPAYLANHRVRMSKYATHYYRIYLTEFKAWAWRFV